MFRVEALPMEQSMGVSILKIDLDVQLACPIKMGPFKGDHVEEVD